MSNQTSKIGTFPKKSLVLTVMASSMFALVAIPGAIAAGGPIQHVPKFTITDLGTMVGTVLPGGAYTPIDTVRKVKCSNSAGCTINFDTMVEVISQQQDGNGWQIAAYVDGMPAANNPSIGLASNSYYTTAGALFTVSVPSGTHTLSVDVEPGSNLVLEDWQVNYTLLVP